MAIDMAVGIQIQFFAFYKAVVIDASFSTGLGKGYPLACNAVKPFRDTFMPLFEPFYNLMRLPVELTLMTAWS